MEGEEGEEGIIISRQIASLARCRDDIIRDLDVSDVISELLTLLVIDHREKQHVDHQISLEDKAEKLLDILEEKAGDGDIDLTLRQEVIPGFIATLKVKYPWIHQRLTQEFDVPDSKISRVVPIKGSQPHTSPGHGGMRHESRSRHNNKGLVEDVVFSSNDDKFKMMILEAGGGLQSLPPFAVERSELTQVKTALQELVTSDRSSYLVLQGMAGCGKSVLATQAVSDCDLISNYFPGGVFWISVGKECSDKESTVILLTKMRMLCDKLGETYHHRASNSFSLDHGSDLLRTALLKRQNTLLILDDVWSASVIRSFDIGCKILVTTRDISVMDAVNGRLTSINLDQGFTEQESVAIFCTALKTKDLPVEARKIHHECKGSPMVISLIASLLQDHSEFSSDDVGRWKYYLNMLSERKYSKVGKFREYVYEDIEQAISLSFEALDQRHQKLYSDFSLFQDDVGVPCFVLMVLWQMQKYEVENVMKVFVRKSLATEEYDIQKRCYIYFVHDLLLDYLKTRNSDEAVESERHKNLIHLYSESCGDQFCKLPDDGYIYFYLGYHLFKAKMDDCFRTTYFDLEFLGQKLKIAGPADLLTDISKYRDLIAARDGDHKRIEEIQTFAQLVGHRIYGQLDIDIVQIALQTPHLKWIHEQAKTLAQAATTRLYLEWRNTEEWKPPESTVLCSAEVCCLKFIGSGGRHFLAGLRNGMIQLCSLESSSLCHVFSGHNDAVNSLKIFPSFHNDSPSLRMLSASSDRTCKVWNIKTVLEDVEAKDCHSSKRVLLGTSPSPKLLLRPDQFSFDNHRKDESHLTFEFHTTAVTHAEFSVDGNLVVSTSANEVMVWQSKTGQILFKMSSPANQDRSPALQKCVFPAESDPSYLLCSAENQLLLMCSNRSSVYSFVEAHPMRVVEIIYLSPELVCTVSASEVGVWNVSRVYGPSTSRSSSRKALRSRSLSPSGCVQFFQEAPKSLRSCNTLDPNDIRVAWNKRSSKKDVGPNKRQSNLSPTPTLSTEAKTLNNGHPSSYYSANVAAIIEVENMAIQITKVEVTPNKNTNGHLLCASASKCEDDSGWMLACGSSDHKIVLWKYDTTLNYLGSFTSHNGWVSCIDFSCADTSTVLSGSEDHTAMVWDIEEELGTKDSQKNPSFSSVFDDGVFTSCFFTERNTVQIYRNFKPVCETHPFQESITAVALSSSGNFAAVGTKKGRVYQVNLQNIHTAAARMKTLPIVAATFLAELNYDDEIEISALDFDSSGRYLIAGSSSGSCLVFENFIIQRKLQVSYSSCLRSYFFHKQYAVVVTQDASINMVDLYDINDESVVAWKSDTSNPIYVTCGSICFPAAADEGLLVLGTSTYGILYVNLLPKSSLILESTVWKTKTKVMDSPIRSIAVNSDISKLAVGYDNGIVSIWNLTENLAPSSMELILHKSWVRHLQFSPQGIGKSDWLISCGDCLAVWNLDKDEIKPPRRSSFMEERRRRRSGESPARNRLSLEVPTGSKIGRQGKRELLQQFTFRGNYAKHFVTDSAFGTILTVDDTGIFYFIETLNSGGESDKPRKNLPPIPISTWV